jgi:uncharacterized protein YecE (DUF72 family)
MPGEIRIGTAGWSVPPQYAQAFPEAGSHLERYGQVFPAVEINSSFYRPHRPATYARWARSVPEDFRFAVKMPREVTHIRRLAGAEDVLARFLSEIAALGSSLGPLLVQLPPGFAFQAPLARAFLASLRDRFAGHVVWEPRHPSWFCGEAEVLLAQFEVARVAADPARVPCAAEPGGWPGLAYYRLHGSPEIYHSGYGAAYVSGLAGRLNRVGARTAAIWCIFDNTARGEAASDALALLRLVTSAG